MDCRDGKLVGAGLKTAEFNKVSCAIKCESPPERDKALNHFMGLGYQIIGDNQGLAIFINPFDRQILTTGIEVAEDNFKDNAYNIVDFTTFITFII